MDSTERRAVVIGAGLGGLGIALLLASRGWRVTVCERASSAGGKMNRWKVAGYVFDTGPSLITIPWVFEQFFIQTGFRLQDYVEWMRVEPIASYHFPDGVFFQHTADLPAWLETVQRQDPRDVTGFLRYMALGERLYEISQETFFKYSPYEKPHPQTLRVLPKLPLRRAWGPYHRTVKYFFRSGHLQKMFLRYMTYVGSSPYRSPATLSVIPFIEYVFGAWHVRGGLYRIIETLVQLLESQRVELRLNTPVIQISHRNGRVTGVALPSGESLPAQVVIMNGDASRANALLGHEHRDLPPQQRSLSGVVLLFALRDSLEGWPHHSVFFSHDYAAEFGQLFGERRFPDDPTVYVNMPSRTDRSMVPSRGEVMFVMANAPADDTVWDDAYTALVRQRMLKKLNSMGFPDFQSLVLAESVFTPRDFAQRYDMPGGAIYGQVSHGWRGAFLRPPNRHPRIRGLYYVGGSTHPGGGTPTVLLSALITARLIGQDWAH